MSVQDDCPELQSIARKLVLRMVRRAQSCQEAAGEGLGLLRWAMLPRRAPYSALGPKQLEDLGADDNIAQLSALEDNSDVRREQMMTFTKL